MPDYARGKIYKIVCNITGEQYIGATTQKLSQRLTCHVSKKNTDKIYKSKNIILRGDYQIVLIENYPCNNREELDRKEREHIEANTCVNKIIPTRTREEYFETNKEAILLRSKEWYEANKESHLLRCKEYRETHKEEIVLQKKEYRDTHKEEIALGKKEHYNTHKEAINLKCKEYRDTHKAEIALLKKKWAIEHKDELNRKSRERYQKKKQEKMEAANPII
jgi:hypothetical protein